MRRLAIKNDNKITMDLIHDKNKMWLSKMGLKICNWMGKD